MNTEIYIEGFKADLTADIGARITRSVNDVRELDTKNSSYTKTIKLPGTTNNNQIFGHILNPTRAQGYNAAAANVHQNYNASQPAACAIYMGGLLAVQGALRILKINDNGSGMYEYECTVYGVVGSFAGAMSKAGDLSDLDFSGYDEFWNLTTMNAYSTPNAGAGLYFPLIDYGNVSTDKIHYQFTAMRPALFVRQYLDMIITKAGYTFDCPFFDSDFFKRLIVPHNQDQVFKMVQRLLQKQHAGGATMIGSTPFSTGVAVPLATTIVEENFSTNGSNDEFTYTAPNSALVNITFHLDGYMGGSNSPILTMNLQVNGTPVFTDNLLVVSSTWQFSNTVPVTLNTGDVISMTVGGFAGFFIPWSASINNASIVINADQQQVAPLHYGDMLQINQLIPKGVKQKDFLLSVMNMFNLYITEDRYDDKKLVIRPYPLFYSNTANTAPDWSDKVDRSQPRIYTPLSELAGRRIYFRYTEDEDYYNALYRTRHTANYGNHSAVTGFAFGEAEREVKVIFAATPIVRKSGTDKAVSTIMKGTPIIAEEVTGSKIRILYANTISGTASWNLLDGGTVLTSYTSYNYAGHLDYPDAPTLDLNWGSLFEVFYDLSAPYTSNNLFTAYWQHYVNEITNKDSLMITCFVYLTQRDFAELDFSKYVFIDGNLWTLNQVIDYDTENDVLTKVELLKVINTI